MMICARIVPAGETMQVFGGIEPVPLGDLDVLIELLDADEPDPEELVAFCSRRFAPPLLTNTEGDSLVLCDLVLSVSDPDMLSSDLDRTYRRTDPEVFGMDSGADDRRDRPDPGQPATGGSGAPRQHQQ